MGLAAEAPAARPQMSTSKEVDFVAEAERIRQEQGKLFMKVPGSLPPVGKMEHEKAAMLTQMKKKSLPQLREILERQEKLLANKLLVAKLPDKGAKARATVEEVKHLINAREQELDLAARMERLQLPDTQAMEWRGGGRGGVTVGSGNQHVDSDDSDQETEGTLRLLAEKDLPSRLVAAAAQQLEDLDLFAAQKAVAVDRIAPKERFVPFACTERSSKGGGSSRSSTPNSNSAANQPAASSGGGGGLSRSRAEDPRYVFKEPPMPLPPDGNTQSRLLSLQESLELQQRQAAQARQLQLEAATARLLAATRGVTMEEREEMKQVEDSRWRETATRDSDDDDSDGDNEGQLLQCSDDEGGADT